MPGPAFPSIDFAAELNDEQLAAVQAPDGPVLVIAAAGTGKTRTLIYRVAYLVQSGVEASRILLLTFTNRAAGEMLERARDLVGPSVSGLWGGTFHHLANRVLRRHAEALGYQLNFTILDSDDQRVLIRNIVDELGLKDKQFPKPDVLLSIFSFAVNTDRTVQELAEERFENHPVNVSDIIRIGEVYEARKKELNGMDFDDLLVNALLLFEKNPGILAEYQDRFLHVMVDEFQDTNYIQARLVEMLAGKHKNLLVVGDDFQSIYSWRGANYRNIIEFPEKHEGTHVFKLETNYRSVPEILDIANVCIAGNPEQFQKQLRAVRDQFKKPIVAEPRSGDDQSRFIVRKIHELKREGYPMREICILYRSHFHAMEIQLELSRERIPYSITSGVRFFEQAHIKDVCSFLRILQNPGDELAFLRLVGMLPKVGPKTAVKMWKKLGGRFAAATPGARETLRSSLPAASREIWSGVDFALDRFVEDGLAQNPSEAVHYFVDKFYDRYAVDTFDNYQRRLEDVNELMNYVGKFDSLQAFLDEMALVTNVDIENTNQEDNQDSIRLSTVHQAKGLEWAAVFVVWLTDGMFPSGRSLDDDGGESEERRLFYVASTRARDSLFLLSPRTRRQRDGGVVYYSPSRFVQELPEELLVKEQVSYY